MTNYKHTIIAHFELTYEAKDEAQAEARASEQKTILSHRLQDEFGPIFKGLSCAKITPFPRKADYIKIPEELCQRLACPYSCESVAPGCPIADAVYCAKDLKWEERSFDEESYDSLGDMPVFLCEGCYNALED